MTMHYLLLHHLFYSPSLGAIALMLTALAGLVALPLLWYFRPPWRKPPRRRPPLLRLLLVAGAAGVLLTLVSSRDTLSGYVSAPGGSEMLLLEMFADSLLGQLLAKFLSISVFVLGISTAGWWIMDRFRGAPPESLPPLPGPPS